MTVEPTLRDAANAARFKGSVRLQREMQKIIRGVAGVALVGILSGCASTGAYFADRGRDAMDIVTCTVGTGNGGIKARIGPIYAGLFQNADVAGLRGGSCFALTEETSQMWDCTYPHALWCVIGFYEEGFFSPLYGPPHRGQDDPRHKSFGVAGVFPFLATEFDDHVSGYSKAAYCGQVEVAGGFIGTLRLGLNLVESFDFILGWIGMDILQDDAVRRKLRTESNPVPEDTARKLADPQR